MPTDIVGEIVLSEPSDYAALIPDGLPPEFSAADFARTAATAAGNARMAIHLLVSMNLAQPSGRQGNRRLYRLVE